MKHFRWIKPQEICTYLCAIFPVQSALRLGGKLTLPSTNIEERNRAKTQSAVVFIPLTKVSVNEKFWCIY